jgi:hypothetical protein
MNKNLSYNGKNQISDFIKYSSMFLLLILLLIISGQPAVAGKIGEPALKDLLVSEGDSLMKTRELKNYKEAYVKYKKALAIATDDFDKALEISRKSVRNHY